MHALSAMKSSELTLSSTDSDNWSYIESSSINDDSSSSSKESELNESFEFEDVPQAHLQPEPFSLLFTIGM